MHMKAEVRVLTYKRPIMLYRALMSLVAQSHPHWKAFVFDDSLAGEGESVVRRLGDSRIVYCRNASNLGMAANTDQAFQPTPIEDADFGCILEDDNWLFPNFI